MVVVPNINMTPGITAILVQMAHLEMITGSSDITEKRDVVKKLDHFLRTALRAWGRKSYGRRRYSSLCAERCGVHYKCRSMASGVQAVLARHFDLLGWVSATPPGSRSRARLLKLWWGKNPHVMLVEALTNLSAWPQTAPAELTFLVHSACAALVGQLYDANNLERRIEAYETGILPALLQASQRRYLRPKMGVCFTHS